MTSALFLLMRTTPWRPCRKAGSGAYGPQGWGGHRVGHPLCSKLQGIGPRAGSALFIIVLLRHKGAHSACGKIEATSSQPRQVTAIDVDLYRGEVTGIVHLMDFIHLGDETARPPRL